MFDKFRDNFINFISSRMTVLFVVFTVLGAVMLYRLFDMQIVHGEETLGKFQLRTYKETQIPSTRGNIYDCNGELLAYNELAYKITIQDTFESGRNKNAVMNDTILRTIKMIESNGDSVVSDFNIIIGESGQYEFAVSETRLLRFLADVYGHPLITELGVKEKNATADEVMEYMARKFGIGERTDPDDSETFVPFKGFTKKEGLQLVTVRYAMSANSFQQYLTTTIATQVSDRTVAMIMENSSELEGIQVEEDTIRKYVNGTYFAHIIGYTGKISQEELAELNAGDEEGLGKDTYSLNDVVGKAGIEQYMERQLQGRKGTRSAYVNNVGKIVETINETAPEAGNDVYLSIDSKLQEVAYQVLEQRIAGVLYSKIINTKEYEQGNASASAIKVPIYDVYYALIQNGIIDISHFEQEDAKETEKAAHAAFLAKREAVYERLEKELFQDGIPYRELSKEYQVYETYIIQMLEKKGVLKTDSYDKNDATYIAWKTEETISMREFLEYAISMYWVDITKIEVDSQYSDSAEVYNSLCRYLFSCLDEDNAFSKRLYKYMLLEDRISPRQICYLLVEQDVVDADQEEWEQFESGPLTPYGFMMHLLKTLQITPAQLALDPCSGSCVITDVNTGKVKALVSYPSYDNNRLANGIDAEYYARLNEDLSTPMINYATQQKLAPGSTFKPVSATAGLVEGTVTTGSRVFCGGVFTKLLQDNPKCWKASGHGSLDVAEAITNSCNVFFYDVGYGLSLENDTYNEQKGVDILAKYADLYGLSEKSGVEIEESEPQVSDEYPVPTAIGHGNAAYTTVGLARYATTLANSGTCYELTLLDKVTDHNGNLLKEYKAQVRNTVEMPESYWDAIHRGMRGVITSKSYFQDFGVDVAGKTGTAQQVKSRPNHAAFIGYAPYEAPQIAIATRIAFGYASDYAVETSKEILAYYFELKDTDEVLTGTADTPVSAGLITD